MFNQIINQVTEELVQDLNIVEDNIGLNLDTLELTIQPDYSKFLLNIEISRLNEIKKNIITKIEKLHPHTDYLNIVLSYDF